MQLHICGIAAVRAQRLISGALRHRLDCRLSLSSSSKSINSTSTIDDGDRSTVKVVSGGGGCGPDFRTFLRAAAASAVKSPQRTETVATAAAAATDGPGKSVYIATHGCQMNVADTEVVVSILGSAGYAMAQSLDEADIYLLMTCAVRESAEAKIRKKLRFLVSRRRRGGPRRPLTVGILGCMAERLKTRLFDEEPAVRVICGPDAYRDLPRLLADTEMGQRGANTRLSLEETYADVNPTQTEPGAAAAFVSIMRGCDNHCAFCVVPQTRGRERSTPVDAVLSRVDRLVGELGVREVTLLGQNVNSYRDITASQLLPGPPAQPSGRTVGFSAVYADRPGGRRFPELLDALSLRHPACRFRFTAPHPKDFPGDLLQLIGQRPNLAKQLHLPAQSGSTDVLARMRRGYTREAYLRLVEEARAAVPGLAITGDLICGFCGETEAEHAETLELLRLVRYSFVYHFPYSQRERTRAHKLLPDDVPTDVKVRRSDEVSRLFRSIALKENQQAVGQRQLVLIEGDSRRSSDSWQGRNDQGVRVVLPKAPDGSFGVGDFVAVRVARAGEQTLLAVPLMATPVPGGPGGFAAALATLDGHGNCGDCGLEGEA